MAAYRHKGYKRFVYFKLVVPMAGEYWLVRELVPALTYRWKRY